MRTRPVQARDIFASPILIGTMILAVASIGMVLSYNASRGLPYVPVYQISFDVHDAKKLVPGGSEVRVDGARVGLVKEVKPERPRGNTPAFARIKVALDKELEGIPVDSKVQIRPRSILGAKFVDLTLGKSSKQLPAGGVLPISQSLDTVDLDEAFNVFDQDTTRGLRAVVTTIGDALAGRGTALNEAIGSAGRLVDPAQRVLKTVVAPQTDLSGFITGADQFTRALAPVAPQAGSLFDHAATTLAAVDAAGDALGRAIEALPSTEAIGTSTLTKATPVLADAAEIVKQIRPGTQILPLASRRVAGALVEGTRTLRDGRGLAALVRGLVEVTKGIDSERAGGTLRNLISAVQSLGQALQTINPAQINCNAAGLFMRNIPSVLSAGDSDGAMLAVMAVVNAGQMLQSAAPAPDMHNNPAPVENATECEAGNEPFIPGQQIGNAPGQQPNSTEETSPPAGVRELAEKAGLIAPSPGGAR